MHLYKRLYSFFHVSQPETTFFRHNFCIFPINFIQTFHPPSSFLILPFAADNFPFFRSLFVNLTSLSCFFFFLPSNFLHGSAGCTAFSPWMVPCTQHHQVAAGTLSLVLLFSFLFERRLIREGASAHVFYAHFPLPYQLAKAARIFIMIVFDKE